MKMPIFARWLGLSGLLPLMAVVAILGFAGGTEIARTALGLGLIYAALILSFLGGLWWGLAAASGKASAGWIWGVAVLPSLYAWVPLGLAQIGIIDVRLALALVGVGLAAALFIDRALAAAGLAPPWWMSLRWPLSGGLAALCLLAAALG